MLTLALLLLAFTGSDVQELMLARNNAIRAERNLPAMELDERLCKAAQDQADYLARTRTFSHHVNGTPRTRAAKYGFPVKDFTSLEVRENIAGDFSTVENAFRGWCGSSGHYANIVSNCNRCGFAVAKDTSGANYWVAVYGREE